MIPFFCRRHRKPVNLNINFSELLMVKKKRTRAKRKDVLFMVTKKGKVRVFGGPRKTKSKKRKTTKKKSRAGGVWKRWRQRK